MASPFDIINLGSSKLSNGRPFLCQEKHEEEKKYYNKINGRRGHLFGKRFKNIVITDEA